MFTRPTWPRRATAITMVIGGFFGLGLVGAFRIWPLLDDDRRVVLLGMYMVGLTLATLWAVRSEAWS